MPSDQVLNSLLARTSRARQVRRWRGLAAAAAVVLVAGCGRGGELERAEPARRAGGQRDLGQRRSAANAATHVSATVRYTAKELGHRRGHSGARACRTGVRCSLVVTDAAGQTVVAGSWKTSYDEGKTWYTGGSSVMLDSVRSFQIISGGRVLVTVPAH